MTLPDQGDKHLNPRVDLIGAAIDEVDTHTYFGIRISINLRWKDHIEDVASEETESNATS